MSAIKGFMRSRLGKQILITTLITVVTIVVTQLLVPGFYKKLLLLLPVMLYAVFIAGFIIARLVSGKCRSFRLIVKIAYPFIAAACLFIMSVQVLAPTVLFYPYFAEESYNELKAYEDAEELTIDTEKGSLSGWFLHNVTMPAPLVIYFGGNAENSSGRILWFCTEKDKRTYLDGFNFAFVDYPGYGKSEGSPSGDSLREYGLAVYDALSAREDVTDVYIMGFSIGTGIANYVASERQVDKLMLFAPYENGVELFNNFLDVFHGPMTSLISFTMDADKYAEKVDVEPLIIASKSDEIVSYESSERLSRIYREGCRFITLEEQSHNEIWSNSKTLMELALFLQWGDIDKKDDEAPAASLGSRKKPKSVEDIEPYAQYLYSPVNDLTACDFSDKEDLLLTISFSNYTKFPKAEMMPDDIDMNALIEWGRYPGLHMDVLYKHGLTGQGGVIAIIDQPMCTDHQDFKDAQIVYHEMISGDNNSMHAAGVAALIITPGIGTAPEATLHVVEDATWEADYANTLKAVNEMIESNKKLPENERITMFSMSDQTVREGNRNPDAIFEAISASEENNIWVWLCDYPLKLNDGVFDPFCDKDDPANLHNAAQSNATQWTTGNWDEVLTVPAGGRTTAYTVNGNIDEYAYWSDGGVSKSVPYLAGLALTAHGIAPDMTQKEMCELFMSTADEVGELNVISPVRFMAKVLRHAGNNELADTIINEAGITE